MMMQFFNTSVIKDDSVLKNEYRRLVRIHHPDRGGNDEMMKMLNEEYGIMKKYLVSGYMPGSYRGYEKATSTKREEKREVIIETFYDRLNSRFNVSYRGKTLKEAIMDLFGKNIIIDIFIHKGGREGYILYLDVMGNRVAAAMKMKIKKTIHNADITLIPEYSDYMDTLTFEHLIRMPMEMFNKLDNLDLADNYSYEEKERSYNWRKKVETTGYSSTSMKQNTKKRKLNHGERIRILNGYVTIAGEKADTFVVVDMDNKIKFNWKGKLYNINNWEKWDYEIV
ncbi:MAG: hypothetical protein PHT94_00685 [Candidatus Nanoarchaeia archaeon]|nr:hypothetical protein [Candidatus Nanoarchaeia archaeon]